MLLYEDDGDPAAVEAIERGLTAEELIEWADTLDPESGLNRAALLTSTAQFLGYRDRHDDALVLFLAAVEDGGPVPPDTRLWLADGYLNVGDLDRARALFDEVRHDLPTNPTVYEVVGECWEERSDLEEAHRWFTLGWLRCSEADDADDQEALRLLVCRRRVRLALEWPLDDLDDSAEEYLAERRAEREYVIEASIQAFIPRGVWDEWPYERPPGSGFDEQIRLIERVLREDPAAAGTMCVPLDAGGLAAYAETRGLEPGTRTARLEYAELRVAEGHGVEWPPGRNEPCWCGSGSKYKKCCGRPVGV